MMHSSKTAEQHYFFINKERSALIGGKVIQKHLYEKESSIKVQEELRALKSSSDESITLETLQKLKTDYKSVDTVESTTLTKSQSNN